MPNRPHKAWHHRGYLPHFDSGAVVQTLTFRLADSLPRMFYERMAAMDDANRRMRLEEMIDEGRGSCLLRDDDNAAIVQAAFEHFDGDRYRLIAWVIMPNHVHVMIEQIEGYPLSDVVHSWKSYTAKKINERRRANGVVWAAEYFDRYIRDGAHFANAVRYIEENPVKAGLADKPSDLPYSSAASG